MPEQFFNTIKNYAQYGIGLAIFILIGLEVIIKLGLLEYAIFSQGSYIRIYLEMPVLEMVSIALGAATAVELAYMLFTPGPDEALQPVLMGVAAFILHRLSDGSIKADEIFAIALLIITIPLLFWTKHYFFDKNKSN